MASDSPKELPAGFEIRPLEMQHLDWAAAIIGHTMSFDALFLAKVQYPGGPTKRAYEMARSIRSSCKVGIASGLSYGVFDTNWKPRYSNTQPGGQLHWDTQDLTADREKLLEQMDFPLVAIAMSKDCAGPKPAPEPGVIPWAELAGGRTISDRLKERDTSGKVEPPSNTPSEMGKVVKRSGTHTRGDFANTGLATVLSHHVMREMARKGYRAIVIHTGHPAVTRAWENPPAPFRAVAASSFNTAEEQDVFGGVGVVTTRIWVILRE